MNKIDTDSDVKEWAKMMVDANGEKFTPLSKGDQFAIARFIVNGLDGNPSIPDSPPASEEEGTGEKVSRGLYFHSCGYDAQSVYDKFLEWSNQHPTEKEVMDFSNGQKSGSAAFAYWLCEEVYAANLKNQ